MLRKNSPPIGIHPRKKLSHSINYLKKFDKFNFREFSELKKLCNKKKLSFLTTLFDTESVDKYNKLIKVYKISSSDITNVPLLRKIGTKNKHVIISTGASTI